MNTNKEITLPHPNNSTLNFKKKSPPLYPLTPQFSQKSTPFPAKKNLPNLERFHKNCACSLSNL